MGLVLDGCDGFEYPDRFRRQLDPFCKEGLRLPSFFVKVFSIVALKKKESLKLQKTIGEFTYYLEEADGFWFSFGLSFICLSSDFSSASIYVGSVESEAVFKEMNYLLMFAFRYTLVASHSLMIHASSIIYRDCGIVFCGLSGAGKSTQANLWKKFVGASVLNYDKPCIVKESDHYIVHGSPWSGKERVFLNKYAPLDAIVFVNQAPNNHVERISPAVGFAKLYLNNYLFPISSYIESENMNVMKDIVKQVPIYQLDCDISRDAVEVLRRELF